MMDDSNSSIFVQDDAPVYDMPVSAINRPLPSTLGHAKVQQFVEDMQVGAEPLISLTAVIAAPRSNNSMRTPAYQHGSKCISLVLSVLQQQCSAVPDTLRILQNKRHRY
jgi:hypothetical protein